MSRYGSVNVTGPASLLTRIVQSAEPADLASRVNAAIAALPAGYVVVGITLAGGGDGHTFTVTVEAGVLADVTGGFTAPPTVACFLASEAEAMQIARAAAGPASGPFADTQVAGSSKGTRFMGMVVKGTVDGGGGGCPPLSILLYVDNATTVPLADRDGSICAPYGTIMAAVNAHAAETDVRFILTNKTYPEAVVFPATMRASLSCLWGMDDLGVAVVSSITATEPLILQGVYLEGAAVAGALTGSGPVVGMDTLTATGLVTLSADVVEINSIVGGTVINVATPWTMNQQVGEIEGGFVLAVASPGASVTFRGLQLRDIDTNPTGPNISVQDCVVWEPGGPGGAIVNTDLQNYTRCLFGEVGSLTATTVPGKISLVDCEFQAVVTVTATVIEFDLYSWQRFVAAGGVPVGTVSIIGSLYQPAVPADWVGAPPTTIYEALDRIAAALGPIA